MFQRSLAATNNPLLFLQIEIGLGQLQLLQRTNLASQLFKTIQFFDLRFQLVTLTGEIGHEVLPCLRARLGLAAAEEFTASGK